MGLTNWRGTKVRKQDVANAKNYLAEDELKALNNLVEQYLVFAEGQAMRRIIMSMSDWLKKLDGFLTLNDREILTHAGKISHDMAKLHAKQQYDRFHKQRLENMPSELDSLSDLSEKAQSLSKKKSSNKGDDN